MDSMSSGATVLKLAGTPSTSTKGLVPPKMEEVPLRLIWVPWVGSPEGADTESPATLPWINWAASLTLPCTKSSDLTVDTALVTSARLWVPYPITTTSESCCRSSLRTTCSGPLWAAISWATNPRRSEEHTSELQSREHLVCRLLREKKNR